MNQRREVMLVTLRTVFDGFNVIRHGSLHSNQSSRLILKGDGSSIYLLNLIENHAEQSPNICPQEHDDADQRPELPSGHSDFLDFFGYRPLLAQLERRAG